MEPPGRHHGHIAAVRWVKKDSPESGESTRVELVEWIGERTDAACVLGHKGKDKGEEIEVRAIRPKRGRAYIRSYRNGKPGDNLLLLPRYGVSP